MIVADSEELMMFAYGSHSFLAAESVHTLHNTILACEALNMSTQALFAFTALELLYKEHWEETKTARLSTQLPEYLTKRFTPHATEQLRFFLERLSLLPANVDKPVIKRIEWLLDRNAIAHTAIPPHGVCLRILSHRQLL